MNKGKKDTIVSYLTLITQLYLTRCFQLDFVQYSNLQTNNIISMFYKIVYVLVQLRDGFG